MQNKLTAAKAFLYLKLFFNFITLFYVHGDAKIRLNFVFKFLGCYTVFLLYLFLSPLRPLHHVCSCRVDGIFLVFLWNRFTLYYC